MAVLWSGMPDQGTTLPDKYQMASVVAYIGQSPQDHIINVLNLCLSQHSPLHVGNLDLEVDDKL